MKILFLFVMSLIVFNATAQDDRAWLNFNLPIEERVDLLLSEMTTEEKASQMLFNSKAIPRLGIEYYNWWNEALHGVARSAKATVFPQTIGLAATFDDDLVYKIASAISDEARAINNERNRLNKTSHIYMGLSFWSPNVNIFRDPRWGRGQETYGEDPLLSGKMGAAFVRGMQGNHPKYLKTAACAKHFAVHSGPEGERHGFNAIASPKDLYETYLPAFKYCVDAGVEAVMGAYNRTNHEPCCGSKALLKDILRDEWNFQGHILSDCWALVDFHQGHHFTNSEVESATLALKSGINLNCGVAYNSLMKALDQGLITEDEINEAFRPLLKTRFKLGMFDPANSNPYHAINIDVINNAKHVTLAREAAQKGIVLLQNKNNVLPLKKDLEFIYMLGPLGADALSLMGNYNGQTSNYVTVVEGIVDKVSPITRVEYRSGSDLKLENKNPIDWHSEIVKESSATIAVVGLTVLLEGEEGEAIISELTGDNPTMQLPDTQLQLIRSLSKKAKNNHKPLIVVVCAGMPIDLSEIKDLADAIIYAWYPGEQGGNAVADILFGDVSPSGKLPITFPESTDQLPPFNDYNMTGRTYKYMTKKPLYPFGFGLSYSKFSFANLKLSNNQPKPQDNLRADFMVTNTGDREADEVIQLYISLKNTKEQVPLSEMKDFKRIHLKPGESRSLSFEITPSMFNYINAEGKSVRHKGNVEIIVSNASPGSRSKELGTEIISEEIRLK